MKKRYLLVVFFIFLPQLAFAFNWLDLFVRHDQQGAKALAQGNPLQATQLFDNPQWSAVAHYRAGQYQQAIAVLSKQSSGDANYNRGNALAHLGQYQAAIKAYEQALQINPKDEDAKFNRDLLKKLLQQQNKKPNKSQSEQKQNQNQNQNQDSKSEQNQNTKQNQSNKSDQNQNNNSSQDQSSTQAEQTPQHQSPGDQTSNSANQEATTQTKSSSQQAVNDQKNAQWLHQIPDDPGGLLRQKFLRDHLRELQGN